MPGSCCISFLATIFVFAGTLPASPSPCIHLYNLADASPKTLDRATVQARKIFQATGITITWLQPPVDSPEAHLLDQNNLAPTQLDSTLCLVLRLMPNAPLAFPGALGFALPFARSGVNVEILYDPIKAQAISLGIPEYTILAYAMAHEIGHVLLHSSAHSRAGIMSTNWNLETWRFVSFGMLKFLPEQTARMRAELNQPRPTTAILNVPGFATGRPVAPGLRASNSAVGK